jgi:predicted ester cyclase
MSSRDGFFRSFCDVWATGKVELLDDLLSDNVVYHMQPFDDMDLGALKEFITGFHLGFPDFSLTIDEQLFNGDSHAVRWTCTATYTGETSLLSVPPTGKRTGGSGGHFIHWQDGLPVEIWHNGDWLGWLQKCGVLPPLGH